MQAAATTILLAQSCRRSSFRRHLSAVLTAAIRRSTYTRASENPNRIALEECLAALEGGAAAAAFASGMAAIAATLQCLAPGDHVLLPDDLYHGTRRFVREILGPWGLAYDFVDMTDLDVVRAAMRPQTRLVWIETPSNPLLKITDIAAVAEIARAGGALTAVDNTWASPIGQQPLALGADLVMHATTKYLGGHSDILGGAIIARENGDFFQRVSTVQKIGGAVPAPFDCWLLLRSIRTLPYRMRAHAGMPAPSPGSWRVIRPSPPCTIPGCPTIPAMLLPPGRCGCMAACCRCRSRAGPRKRWP